MIEETNYENLEECLKLSIDELQSCYKERLENRREIQRQIELTRLSEKKIPQLLDEVRKVEKEVAEVSKNIQRLGVLLSEYSKLRTEISNLLLSMSKYADEIKDIKLQHFCKTESERFKVAGKIV